MMLPGAGHQSSQSCLGAAVGRIAGGPCSSKTVLKGPLRMNHRSPQDDEQVAALVWNGVALIAKGLS